MSRTKKQPSAAQLAYFIAKAQFDAIHAECIKACEAVPVLDEMSDAEIEQVSNQHDAIYERLGYYTALDVLRRAEQAMLDWAHAQVAKLPQYKAHAADIEKVITTNSPKFRTQVIDLAARLSA